MSALDHREGQYRASLFEELIGTLLVAMYGAHNVHPHYVVPRANHSEDQRALSFDFMIRAGNQRILVEAKAPYRETGKQAIEKMLVQYRKWLPGFDHHRNIYKVIFAVAERLPETSNGQVKIPKDEANIGGAHLEIWDAAHIGALVEQYLHAKLGEMSLKELAKIVTDFRGRGHGGPATASREQAMPLGNVPKQPVIATGKVDGVVFACADFCSFSKFVAASGSDSELISSIMGRFYRQSRDIANRYGAIVEKFMGDGMLFYWLPSAQSVMHNRIDKCAAELIGSSIKLGNEWKGNIDRSVDTVGMRIGCAMGDVLFIPENIENGPVHAIGECINIASRLQGEARPNTLLLSNKVNTSYFASEALTQRQNLHLKNIGEVDAWEKDYNVVGSGGL